MAPISTRSDSVHHRPFRAGIVDLRDAVAATPSPSTGASVAAHPPAAVSQGGLSFQLARWTNGRWALDKHYQCAPAIPPFAHSHNQQCVRAHSVMQTSLRRGGGRRVLSRCSNWAARPLCQGQLAYAAADAACLFVLCDALMAEGREAPVHAEVVPTPSSVRAACGGGERERESERNASAPASDVIGAVRRLVAAAAPDTCAVIRAEDCIAHAAAVGGVLQEVNALCVLADGEPVLVLVPGVPWNPK